MEYRDNNEDKRLRQYKRLHLHIYVITQSTTNKSVSPLKHLSYKTLYTNDFRSLDIILKLIFFHIFHLLPLNILHPNV